MSMETTAWTQLYSVMNAKDERRPFARATMRRIGAFARPHRRRIVRFVLLGVATALLAVATPVLAGKVVDAIVSDGDEGTVVRLALLIALIAVAEAVLGIFSRRLSATLGEGLILDLRTACQPSGTSAERLRTASSAARDDASRAISPTARFASR